jgi:hypothetical protein
VSERDGGGSDRGGGGVQATGRKHMLRITVACAAKAFISVHSLDVLHCGCDVVSHSGTCIQLRLLLKVTNPGQGDRELRRARGQIHRQQVAAAVRR